MTDKNSTLLVYTYRNNHTPIKIKNTFKYAACFDDEGQLIYYGKYNNGNRITGLFLNQSKQIGMFIRSLTSVTYYNGKENYNNYYSKESIIYDSKYSYKEWIINKIKIIEK